MQRSRFQGSQAPPLRSRSASAFVGAGVGKGAPRSRLTVDVAPGVVRGMTSSDSGRTSDQMEVEVRSVPETASRIAVVRAAGVPAREDVVVPLGLAAAGARHD